MSLLSRQCRRLQPLRGKPACPLSIRHINSKRSENFRLDNEYGEHVIKGKGPDAKFFNQPYLTLHYPGSRFVELVNHNKKNPLTSVMLDKITSQFLMIEDNHAVNVVLLGNNTELCDTFSTGVAEKDLLVNSSALFQSLYRASRTISTYKKDFVGICGGNMTGTPLGLLLNSKFRVGTPSLHCQIDELTRGFLPGGGLAYHFSRKGGIAGLMLSRYLAFSARSIQANDLYELGLITHLVLENPYHTFCESLGHSIGSESQAVQQLPAADTAAQEILDTMHAGDPEGFEDPLDHPFWEKFMLVNIQKFDSEKIRKHHSDISEHLVEVSACFNAPTAEEAFKRVASAAPGVLYPPPAYDAVRDLNFVDRYHWASATLRHMEKCDPLAVKAWYRLTKLCADPKMSLKNALQLETHVNTNIAKRRKQRLAALTTIQRGDEGVDRAVVMDNIVTRLVTVSNDDVDELFEGAPYDKHSAPVDIVLPVIDVVEDLDHRF